MGRKRTSPRPRAIHVNIPEDVLAPVDEKLYDPYKGKPIYGGYSVLITALLRKWLEEPEILPIQLVEEPVEAPPRDIRDIPIPTESPIPTDPEHD